MKIICIRNNKWNRTMMYDGLIFSKEYECIKEGDYGYLILLDDNNSRWYPKNCFITKEEYRNKKLEELGI